VVYLLLYPNDDTDGNDTGGDVSVGDALASRAGVGILSVVICNDCARFLSNSTSAAN
jgi:hypothetical protein